MTDDIRDLLISETETISVPRLSPDSVIERGRLRRRRKHLVIFAFSVVVTVGVAVLSASLMSFLISRPGSGPANSPSANDITKGQVGVAALQAVADLPQTWNRLYEYTGVAKSGAGWVAHFTLMDCGVQSGGVTCQEKGDVNLEIEADGAKLSVLKVIGPVTTEEPRRLNDHSSGPKSLEAGYAFQHLRTLDSLEGRAILMAAYWLGPIPASLEGTCKFEGIDEEGKVAFTNQVVRSAPSEEGGRDRLILHEVPDEVVSGRIECSDWREPEKPRGHP